MDLLFLCRDALGTSVITNVNLAIEAKKSGMDVGILFSGAALEAATEGVFRMPPELLEQDMRFKLADNAVAAGVPTAGGRGAARRIDAQASITKAKENGVAMFASPLWVTLLGYDGKLPGEIHQISQADELKMLKEAKKVIGSY